MPGYHTIDKQEYIIRFERILMEILTNGKDFLFVFNQTHEFNNLPNQLLISLLLTMLKEGK